MWCHIDGCAKQCFLESDIYLLSCISLECYIIIDRSVVTYGHRKYVVDVINDMDKRMLKLGMVKLFNTELIRDDPIFQVHAGSLK